MGNVDCVVGINLLREGLDLPEVTLVAILDADKEGFLRSESALIQTSGKRAARHTEGKVIMYADTITKSIQNTLDKCNKRREIQQKYNKENNINPKAINKSIQESLKEIYGKTNDVLKQITESSGDNFDINEAILNLEKEMLEAAEKLEFERAAFLRDKIKKIKEKYD